MNTEIEIKATSAAPAIEDSHARIAGEPLADLPKDLYIPPDALKIFLEAFEGPLDLLLYLIKKQNLDILNIPIAKITYQYIQYIEMMKELQLELAAEYLVMAVTLAEIKSRMLLPQPKTDNDNEEDPRAELVRRLQEYERFKNAAINLDQLPRIDRDFCIATAYIESKKQRNNLPQVVLQDLWHAFKDALEKAKMFTSHHVQQETLSIREKMARVITELDSHNFTNINELFIPKEGRLGVIVTFMAILELLKQATIEIIQTQAFGSIYLKKPDNKHGSLNTTT